MLEKYYQYWDPPHLSFCNNQRITFVFLIYLLQMQLLRNIQV